MTNEVKFDKIYTSDNTINLYNYIKRSINMLITNTITDNNIKIHFVENTLKGFSVEIYSKVIKGRQHRRTVIIDKEEISVKPNKKKKITIDVESKFVFIIEEESIFSKSYELYLLEAEEYDSISLPKNYLVKQEVVDKINSLLQERNEYNKQWREYIKLPQGVRNCYPMEAIDSLFDLIEKNTWYRNQMARLTAVPFVLDSLNAKRWLSKLGAVSVSNDINDLNSLIIFISLRLTVGLPHPDKTVAQKMLIKLIPEGEWKSYLYNRS